MLDELMRRGGDSVGEVEAREVYLGWVDPARDYVRGRFTLSLDSRTVWFNRLDDQQKILEMPGAYSTAGYVAFRIYEPDGVARATAAARKVKCRP